MRKMAPTPQPLVRMSGITKRFGVHTVLQEVSSPLPNMI